MRITAAVLALLMCGVSTAEEVAPDAALIRTALVVSDVDESKRFYQDALGFEARYDGEITSHWVSKLLQLKDGHPVRFVVLQGAVEINGAPVDSAMVGLMHVAGAGEMQRDGELSVASGEAVLAVVCNDIDAVHQRLQKLGANILVPPQASPNGTETEMVVRDPDGIRVHVVERSTELSDTRDE